MGTTFTAAVAAVAGVRVPVAHGVFGLLLSRHARVRRPLQQLPRPCLAQPRGSTGAPAATAAAAATVAAVSSQPAVQLTTGVGPE